MVLRLFSGTAQPRLMGPGPGHNAGVRTELEGRDAVDAPPWRARLSSVRLRITAVSALLLLAALAVSVLGGRLIMESRTDERILREMEREAEEFAALAGGVDPVTGEAFGTDVERIFRVFRDRRRVRRRLAACRR
jgi:hypothetical protein